MSRSVEVLKKGYVLHLEDVRRCKLMLDGTCANPVSERWGSDVVHLNECVRCSHFVHEDGKGLGYADF